MNGLHDMGGMHGFGAVDPTDDAIFHEAWEARMFALKLATSLHMGVTLDGERHNIEKLPPDLYLQGYFERWFHTMLNQSVAIGLIDAETREKLERGALPDEIVKDGEAVDAAVFATLLAHGAPATREEGPAPVFKVGDMVRAVNDNPATHTRLPRYARGKIGRVLLSHGNHVFPDSNAHDKGEDPQPLYTVSFTARALWGEAASEKDRVAIDLWQPYLTAHDA